MSKFACSRCGKCCKNTFYQAGDYLFGIYLEPSEIVKFPDGAVFPLFGRGQPVEVTAYQLGVNSCPNYEESGGLGRCKVYADRPLICRSYPVLGRFKVSSHCPVIQQATDGVDADSLGPELEAYSKKIEYMMSQPENEWIWPLNKREWIPLEKKS